MERRGGMREEWRERNTGREGFSGAFIRSIYVEHLYGASIRSIYTEHLYGAFIRSISLEA